MQIAPYSDLDHSAAQRGLAKYSLTPGAQNIACGGLDNLNALFDELANPMSLWQDLRITVMSGADYVFVPQYVYDAFGGNYPVSRFIAELACAFNIDVTRLQIFAFSDDPEPQQQFCRAVIEWHEGGAGHCHAESIPPSSKHSDYAKSLFKHSMPIIDPTEH